MRARGLPITFPTGSPAEKDNDLGQERSLPCSFPTLSYPSLSFLNSFRVENPCSVHPISEVKVRQPWSEHELRFFPCSSPSLYHSSLLSPLLLPSLCFFNHGIYLHTQQKRSFPLSSAIPLTSQIENGRLYPPFFRKSYEGIFLLVLPKFPSSIQFPQIFPALFMVSLT